MYCNDFYKDEYNIKEQRQLKIDENICSEEDVQEISLPYKNKLMDILISLPWVMDNTINDLNKISLLASFIADNPIMFSTKTFLYVSILMFVHHNDITLFKVFFKTIVISCELEQQITEFLYENIKLFPSPNFNKILYLLILNSESVNQLLEEIITMVYEYISNSPEKEAIDKYLYKIIILTYPNHNHLLNPELYFDNDSRIFGIYQYQMLSFFVFNDYFRFKNLEQMSRICIINNDEKIKSKQEASIIMIDYIIQNDYSNLEAEIYENNELIQQILSCIFETPLGTKLQLIEYFKCSQYLFEFIKPYLEENEGN